MSGSLMRFGLFRREEYQHAEWDFGLNLNLTHDVTLASPHTERRCHGPN